MKRKILAWTAAALIIALVSAAFLRPADRGAANPDVTAAPPALPNAYFGEVAGSAHISYVCFAGDIDVAFTDCQCGKDIHDPRVCLSDGEEFSSDAGAASEPSDSPLAVRSVSIGPIPKYESVYANMNTMIELGLTDNTGIEHLSRVVDRAWLDVLTDDGWQPAPPPAEYYYAVYRMEFSQWGYLREPIFLYLEDTPAQYRLTLEYADSYLNECCTLVLYIDLTEGMVTK